jgi:hypothetical protein
VAAVAKDAAVIDARIEPASAAFVARLVARAERIARAQAEESVRATGRDPWRWRTPRLLWPLFGKDR